MLKRNTVAAALANTDPELLAQILRAADSYIWRSPEALRAVVVANRWPAHVVGSAIDRLYQDGQLISAVVSNPDPTIYGRRLVTTPERWANEPGARTNSDGRWNLVDLPVDRVRLVGPEHPINPEPDNEVT